MSASDLDAAVGRIESATALAEYSREGRQVVSTSDLRLILSALSSQSQAAEGMAKALEPFAKECERQERVTSYRDGDCQVVRPTLTIGEMRRARTALSHYRTLGEQG